MEKAKGKSHFALQAVGIWNLVWSNLFIVALIQFQLSPPKTDMENQVVINDYSQMDRVLKEERQYTLNLVKAIKKSGANVLLVQKSILRDAVSDLAIHYLNKLKILVVKGNLF